MRAQDSPLPRNSPRPFSSPFLDFYARPVGPSTGIGAKAFFGIVFSFSFRGVGLGGVLFLCYGFSEIHRLLDGIRIAGELQTQGAIPHYFHGMYSDHAWSWFMLAVFLIKTPLPFLLLISGGWVLFFQRRYPVPRFGILWLWFPCLFYVGVVSLAKYQIGLRRVLWVYPLMSIWIRRCGFSMVVLRMARARGECHSGCLVYGGGSYRVSQLFAVLQ